MKLILQTLLFCFLAFSITSCDKDDDTMEDPMSSECTKAVTFQVDGTEVCATGTFVITSSIATFTTINLTGDGGETLVISVTGGTATNYPLGTGNGIYTSADGTQFSSSTGSFDVTDNASTMDATFNFEASSSDGSTVSITSGVVVDLPQ